MVYLIYACDEWKTKHDMVLRAVCSKRKQVKRVVEEMFEFCEIELSGRTFVNSESYVDNLNSIYDFLFVEKVSVGILF